MKWLFLAGIMLYQRLAPASLRERCLFAESCSQYVGRHVREDGVVSGLRALLRRFRQCRPGYTVVYSDLAHRKYAVLRDGSVIDSEHASERLRRELMMI